MPQPSRKRKRDLIASLREQFQEALSWTRGHTDPDAKIELNRLQRMIATNLRVIFLVFRIEVYKRVELHAQALTMKSLLALVPLLAVVFAIFKGFGGLEDVEPQVQTWIVENLSGSSQELQGSIRDLLASLQDARLGTFSLVVLIFTVLSLLSHIENSFNTLFGVTSQRATGVRLLTYWAILTLGPLLLGASIALSAALQTSRAGAWVNALGWVGQLAVSSTPLLITWLGFTTLYFVVPGTSVRLRSAVLAAVVTGSMWNAAKWGFAFYAKNAVTIRDIYGSLAAVPMFILWLYVSWLLVLFGAQLCFAFQNAATYRREEPDLKASHRGLERALCRLFIEIARDFYYGRPATRADDAAEALRIPGRLMEAVTTRLRRGGFIRMIDDGGMVPAVDLERVSLEDLLRFSHEELGEDPPLSDDEVRHFIDELLADLAKQRREIAGNLTFREVASRFPFETERTASSEDTVSQTNAG